MHTCCKKNAVGLLHIYQSMIVHGQYKNFCCFWSLTDRHTYIQTYTYIQRERERERERERAHNPGNPGKGLKRTENETDTVKGKERKRFNVSRLHAVSCV